MLITGAVESRHGTIDAAVSPDVSISDALRELGLVLNTRCAGKGVCGGCAIDLQQGTFQKNGEVFSVAEGQTCRVNGCTTRVVKGPFRIAIPRRSMVETGERVVADFILKDYAGFDPSVRVLKLAVPKASLEDARGDFEHIARELKDKHSFDLSGASLCALRELPMAIRQGDYHVTLLTAWVNDRWELLSVHPGGEAKVNCFALAVDIGTTTVAMSLVDLAKGKILDTVSCYNQQIQLADDVANRIVIAATPEGIARLEKLIIEDTINPLVHMICQRHKIDARHIVRMSVSGNTVMWHLFLGIDPAGIGAIPFQPVCRDPKIARANELKIAIHPDAPIDVIPSISAYVGGDIVSDIEACRMVKSNHFSIMIDIGTNGEIAVSDGKQMFVTACAAGPAFEGLRISHGMRASVGAIERITVGAHGDKCHYKTIGGTKPVGICGSGLIDFVAEAFRAGVVTSSGRIDRDLLGKCPRVRLVDGSNQILEYVIAEISETEDAAHAISVTEKDIETLLQAKAAVFAAMNLLVQRMGKTLGGLDCIYLAGGFAKYINITNAITMGLLPEIDLAKYVVIGNGSLAGAYLSMIDRGVWANFRKTIDLPKVIELNLDPNFQDEYTNALFLPNMQEELFAKTMAGLEKS